MANIARIRVHLEQSGYKLQHVAQVLGINTNTLRSRLNGETDFKLGEAERLSKLLNMTVTERDLCFFGPSDGLWLGNRAKPF